MRRQRTAIGTAGQKESSGIGFGCRGRVVRTLDELSAGIDEFMLGEGPTVLDVRISRNVVNITYRRMFYGEDA